MCIWGTLGIRLGGLEETFSPWLQNGPAVRVHLIFPGGQPGGEVSDPLLDQGSGSEAQVSRHLVPRSAPDRLLGVCSPAEPALV